ncbi:MAG: GNAT family N-acetyltransferase [Anaerolineae bacterium]|nr:GNAT family N-acetyltransferase [Anaerolineae bacterium]
MNNKNVWEGKLVRLRAVEPEDWQFHFEWNQLSEMSRSLDQVWFPQSRAAVRQWAEETALKRPEGDCFHLEIETLDGRLVGCISAHSCNPRAGTFSYGVAIAPQYQRRGYASEAVRLVLRYFFQELRYQKVNASVHDFNAPSIQMHVRMGFALEGQLRRMGFTQGEYFDELIFGMTAEEFAALQANPDRNHRKKPNGNGNDLPEDD